MSKFLLLLFCILPSKDAKLNPNKCVYSCIQRLGFIFILSLNLVFFYINSLVGFVLNPVNLPGIELREHDRQEREEHSGAAVQLQQCCCSSNFRLATGGGGHDHHQHRRHHHCHHHHHHKFFNQPQDWVVIIMMMLQEGCS